MDEIPDQDLRYIFGPAYERIALQAAVTSTHLLYAFSVRPFAPAVRLQAHVYSTFKTRSNKPLYIPRF